MKVYRVSNVERFRQFELDDEAEAEDLIRDILGQGETSTAMRVGTAFHSVLERAADGEEIAEAEQDGFTFIIPSDLSVELAPIRELRAAKAYVVDGSPIIISGQVDQIDGKRIDDHKTTSRFDPDRYLEGYQWRLYLDIFGADTFRWNVFELYEVEDGEVYQVKTAHRLEQCRYAALGADCQSLVERFARFVRDRIEGDDTCALRDKKGA